MGLDDAPEDHLCALPALSLTSVVIGNPRSVFGRGKHRQAREQNEEGDHSPGPHCI